MEVAGLLTLLYFLSQYRRMIVKRRSLKLSVPCCEEEPKLPSNVITRDCTKLSDPLQAWTSGFLSLSRSRSSTRSNTRSDSVHRTRSTEGRKNSRRGRKAQRRCPDCGEYDD
ncbi:hypothetical protein EVAR_18136_1 [Eumeta japonica]|uniref:Uncharacterized protein n=1 Tax=Eumeta variegata TaxID=151549 RepID=A0A4C1VH40_EUMVA|nr:hypothetical protein EVAR_18136_1 [Eumeta japonica]